MSEAVRLQSERLPDVPGLVHGIVGTRPYVIQCDDCGRLAVGEMRRDGKPSLLVILCCGINFWGHTGVRRCVKCALAAGVRSFDLNTMSASDREHYEQGLVTRAAFDELAAGVLDLGGAAWCSAMEVRQDAPEEQDQIAVAGSRAGVIVGDELPFLGSLRDPANSGSVREEAPLRDIRPVAMKAVTNRCVLKHVPTLVRGDELVEPGHIAEIGVLLGGHATDSTEATA